MTNAAIADFAKSVINPYIADRKLALKCNARHNRLGRIPRDISKEGAGVKVLAFGFDELDNTIALTSDGFIKQYIR